MVVVGVIGWDLEVFGAQSLKQKRGVVKSLKDRLQQKFNVSVAETGKNDLWQRAELTACVVSNDRRHAESILSKLDGLVGSEVRTRVIDSYRVFY